MDSETKPDAKKGADAASREGASEYLDLIGELVVAGDYDPAPQVRQAWSTGPGFWFRRAALYALASSAFTFLPFLILRGGAHPLGFFLMSLAFPLFWATVVPLWAALGMGAIRDALVEDRPPRLGEQWRRWRGHLPSLFGIHLVHGLMGFAATALLSFYDVGVLALLVWPFLALSWLYAASELMLTGCGVGDATVRGMRLAKGAIPRRVVAFFQQPSVKAFFRPPPGEGRLLITLVVGFAFTFCLTIVGQSAARLLLALGPVPPMATWQLSGLIGSFCLALGMDYTVAGWTGQYMAFLASRHKEGERLALPSPTESGET